MKSTAWNRSLKLLGTVANLAKNEAVSALGVAIRGRDDQQSLVQRVRQAQELVAQLRSLKGAAMKMGQILALEARDYFPDEVVQILEQLQSSAEPMSREKVDSVLRKELGDRRARLENFDYDPIAAASIGQVHRAIVQGQKVAVKIQYPGIDQALDSDLALMKRLAQLLLLVSGRGSIDSSVLVNEVSSIFKQETDYLSEAEFLGEYRSKSSAIDGLWVPESIDDLCSKKVLTMQYAEGITLSDAVRSGVLNRDQREYYADLFMNLYSHEFCIWGLVQTDPNLGNFLLIPEQSKLVLLDFGATKRYSEDFRRLYCQLVVGAYHEDPNLVLHIIEKLGILSLKESDEARQAMVDLIIESMSPFRSKIHDFNDDAYPKQMRDLSRKLMQSLVYSPPPRDLIFLHRKLGGIFQIMRRLESKRSLRPYLSIYEKVAQSL